MSERKYRFHKPIGPREILEAIHEECTQSPQQNGFRPTDTIKDHLVALLHQANSIERSRKDERETAANNIDWALGFLGVLSIAFLANGAAGSNEWTWLDNNRFAIWLWGIAFAAVFLGVSIERSSLFKVLWKFGFTKLVASLALSALVVFSTGKASSILNGVFPVDAAALPLTRAIIAGLLVFQYSYPLLIIVAIFAMLHGLNAAGWAKKWISEQNTYQSPPLQSIAFLLLAGVILVFSWKWVETDFSNDVWPKKAYRLAHVLDFNKQHACRNLRKNLSVVFLGPDQARVLIDVNSAQTDDIESFVDARKSMDVSIPDRFYVLSCDVGPQAD